MAPFFTLTFRSAFYNCGISLSTVLALHFFDSFWEVNFHELQVHEGFHHKSWVEEQADRMGIEAPNSLHETPIVLTKPARFLLLPCAGVAKEGAIHLRWQVAVPVGLLPASLARDDLTVYITNFLRWLLEVVVWKQTWQESFPLSIYNC